jgi:hypothetical protein
VMGRAGAQRFCWDRFPRLHHIWADSGPLMAYFVQWVTETRVGRWRSSSTAMYGLGRT